MKTAQRSNSATRKTAIGAERVGACGSEARLAVLRTIRTSPVEPCRQYLRTVTQLDDVALTAVLVGLRNAKLIETTGAGLRTRWRLTSTVRAHLALMPNNGSAQS